MGGFCLLLMLTTCDNLSPACKTVKTENISDDQRQSYLFKKKKKPTSWEIPASISTDQPLALLSHTQNVLLPPAALNLAYLKKKSFIIFQ